MPAKKKTKAGKYEVHCAHDKIIKLADLIPHPKNRNQHPKQQIELLAAIIAKQGWRAPITVSTRSGFIVRGHGRLAAASLLNATHAPVDYQDYVSDDSEIADLIADNRIAELSKVDPNDMRVLLADMDSNSFDMDLTGYTHVEIKEIMIGVDTDPINPEGDGEHDGKALVTLKVTGDQHMIIFEAMEAIRADANDDKVSDGRCLELICADYLAGN